MRAALLLIAAASLAACSPCDDGTIKVTVTLPDFAVAADKLSIGVTVLGSSSQSGSLDVKHVPGQKTGTFDARIARYQPGDEAIVSVEAYAQDALLLQSSKSTQLPAGCGTLSMDLAFTEVDVRVEQNVKNKVDILFMVDDSPSMAPKQTELKAEFPQLIKILDDFGQSVPAWYHIGVVTSDLGAASFTLGSGQCHPGGRGGKLQALGAGADTTCVAPSGGLNFIDYNQLQKDASGVPNSNLPTGQSLATTFGCMASVGQMGCGFEHQLESVYRALHDKPAENHDFLRDDALLVVVWVTDEDDCSADPTSDLFDPSKTAQYGALLSYRCTQYGIQCGSPPMSLPYGDSMGIQAPCTSLPASAGGKLTDVNKYINFFKSPAGQGGVKVDPQDVILVGITAPSSGGAASILANPNPIPPGPYTTCPGPVDGTKCAVVLQHSCIAPQNTQFFGDPAVRLNQVIGAELPANQQLTSICDTSYQAALESLGQKIISSIGAGCITSPFTDPANPDCIVEDVTQNQDGTTTVAELPDCAKNGAAAPCWKLDQKDIMKCPVVCAKDGDPGQHFGITICRDSACDGGGMVPANTSARVACSTIAVPTNFLTTPPSLPMCGAPL